MYSMRSLGYHDLHMDMLEPKSKYNAIELCIKCENIKCILVCVKFVQMHGEPKGAVCECCCPWPGVENAGSDGCWTIITRYYSRRVRVLT